jgi:hypothetical protein
VLQALIALAAPEARLEEPWQLWAGVLGLVLFIYLLHRFLLRLQKKGIIKYNRGGYAARGAPAILELQSLFDPGKRHVLEAKHTQRKKDEGQGGPDKTGKDDDEDDFQYYR